MGGEGVLYGKSLSLNFAVNPNKVALKSLFKKGGGHQRILGIIWFITFQAKGKGLRERKDTHEVFKWTFAQKDNLDQKITPRTNKFHLKLRT